MTVGNGSSLSISHIESSIFHKSSRPLYLNNILHVPQITKNLISVSKFTRDSNVVFEFFSDYLLIKDKTTRQVLLKWMLKDGLYQLDVSENAESVSAGSNQQRCLSSTSLNKAVLSCSNVEGFDNYNIASVTPSVDLVHSNNSVENVWHRRLGHPCTKVLNHVFHQLDLSINKIDFCASRQYGKSYCLPTSLSDFHANMPLDVVCFDVWGPAPILSLEGYRHYVSFVDDHSRYTWTYPLRATSEVFTAFMHFKAHVERLFNRKRKCLQSDWGVEFRSLLPVLQKLGISFRHPCPHTHIQNGRVERRHRHVVEKGLTLLAQASMPLSFSWEAISTAVFLINRLPTPVTKNKSPFQLVYNTQPIFKFLRVFGVACYPHLRPYNK